MATSLSQLSRIFLRRNSLDPSKLATIALVKRYVQFHDFHTQQQKRKAHDNRLRGFLTCTALASSIGYVLFNWKDDIWQRIQNLDINMPTIYALSLPPSDANKNRDRYNFIADVVEICAPSVVYIEIKDHKRIDFFTGKPATTSNGSGFIVGQDGLILTNAHVVINKPNTSVKVRLQDGSIYTGIVEDVDMQSDLATVRINKNNLPVMKLGTSSNIRPGEFVVAIGSPLALSNTITSGVVSSVNRPSEELGLHNTHMGYIQTDAAITFGNSGGPLVNLNGEAIGINAMKVTAGISFAIPIDYAKEFLKKTESRRKGKGTKHVTDIPRKRYIGITMLTLTPDILFEMQQRNENISPSVRHGVLVWKVMIGSPAHNGGLQAGDIVTHVNDQPVVAAVNIYKILERSGTLHLEVVRKGQVLYINVDPEEI